MSKYYLEYDYKGSLFLLEEKEHAFRMAGPGERNYILRGIVKWGETVELPADIDGDPLTSFSLGDKGDGTDGFPNFPGVKRLKLPRFLGRFPESNILFPDLESIAVDPENKIFTTDGRMLYKNSGKELFLSLAAGLQEATVMIPEIVISLAEHAFENTYCENIVFENPAVTAYSSSFDNSLWLKTQAEAAYVGNMLYRVMPSAPYLRLKEGISRIHENAFDTVDSSAFTLCLPPTQPSFSIPSPLSKIQNIEAYEGSCPNLMEALFPSATGVFDKAANKKVPAGSSHKNLIIKDKDRLFLPLRPSEKAKGYLCAAWDKPRFDHGQYYSIFCELNATEEKYEMLIALLSSGREINYSPCLEFLDKNADGLALYAARNLGEKELLLFLKAPILPLSALSKALKPCMERGLNEALSLLLSLLKNKGFPAGADLLYPEAIDRQKTAEKIWKLDRASLITRFPALTPAISSLKCHFGLTAPDAYGTDGRFFYGNTERVIAGFLNSSVPTEAIYLHSVLHCLYLHPFLHKGFKNHSLWDLCCDIAVWDITLSLSEDNSAKKALSSQEDSGSTALPSTAANTLSEKMYRERNDIIKALKKCLSSLTPQNLYRYYSEKVDSQGSFLSEAGLTHSGDSPSHLWHLKELSRLFRVDSHSYWYDHSPHPESASGTAGAGASAKEQSGSGRENAGGILEKEENNEAYAEKKLFKEWLQRSKEISSRERASEMIRDRGNKAGNKTIILHGIDRTYEDWGTFLRLFSRMMERPIPDPSAFDPGLYNYGLSLYGNLPLIEPLEYSENEVISSLVIAIDSSGSCDTALIRQFLQSTFDILSDSRFMGFGMQIRLIQCDSRIQSEMIIKSIEELKRSMENFQLIGRGGTDFRPVFERVDKLLEKGGLRELDGLIYFTDGRGIFPEKAPTYKCAFVLPHEELKTELPSWAMRAYLRICS